MLQARELRILESVMFRDHRSIVTNGRILMQGLSILIISLTLIFVAVATSAMSSCVPSIRYSIFTQM